MIGYLIFGGFIAVAVVFGLIRRFLVGKAADALGRRFGDVVISYRKPERRQQQPTDATVNASPEEALDVWYATATDAGLTITEEDTDVARDGLIARVKVEGAWYDLLWSRGVVNATPALSLPE